MKPAPGWVDLTDGRNLDEHDRTLLRLLQRDALLTADELARDVPLSPSAITRRVRRLREEKTIHADTAVVSDRIMPILYALIDVQLDRHALPDVEALLCRLAGSANVQAVMEVTGPFDLALIVAVADMQGYNAFVDAQLAGDPIVRRYETRFVKKRRKYETRLPL